MMTFTQMGEALDKVELHGALSRRLAHLQEHGAKAMEVYPRVEFPEYFMLKDDSIRNLTVEVCGIIEREVALLAEELTALGFDMINRTWKPPQ